MPSLHDSAIVVTEGRVDEFAFRKGIRWPRFHVLITKRGFTAAGEPQKGGFLDGQSSLSRLHIPSRV
jgi:hypothetical protein